jgi:ABC-type sugar transport system permease subunit
MKKVLTVLFFLLFTFLFTLVLILGELNFYVLTPAFLKDPMKEARIYKKLTSDPELIMEQLQQQGPGKPLEQMPAVARELSAVVLRSVDAKWLEAESEKAVDALFEYMMSDKETLDIDVDLRVFKLNLRKNLDAWIKTKYASLPEVPVEEFDRQISEGKEKFPMVRPQGLTLEQSLAKTGFDPVGEIMKKIPDKYEAGLEDKDKKDGMNGLSGVKKLRPVFTGVSIAFYVLFILTIGLLILAAKVTSKSKRELFIKLGMYLCAAIAPFITFIITRYVIVNIVVVELIPRAGLPSFVRNDLLVPVLTSAINRVFLHLSLLSGILFLCGLALFILPRVSSKMK